MKPISNSFLNVVTNRFQTTFERVLPTTLPTCVKHISSRFRSPDQDTFGASAILTREMDCVRHSPVSLQPFQPSKQNGACHLLLLISLTDRNSTSTSLISSSRRVLDQTYKPCLKPTTTFPTSARHVSNAARDSVACHRFKTIQSSWG